MSDPDQGFFHWETDPFFMESRIQSPFLFFFLLEGRIWIRTITTWVWKSLCECTVCPRSLVHFSSWVYYKNRTILLGTFCNKTPCSGDQVVCRVPATRHPTPCSRDNYFLLNQYEEKIIRKLDPQFLNFF